MEDGEERNKHLRSNLSRQESLPTLRRSAPIRQTSCLFCSRPTCGSSRANLGSHARRAIHSATCATQRQTQNASCRPHLCAATSEESSTVQKSHSPCSTPGGGCCSSRDPRMRPNTGVAAKPGRRSRAWGHQLDRASRVRVANLQLLLK